MGIGYVVRMFNKYSVLVAGMRGRGKDMLFANVIARRNKPYISNTDYGGQFIPFDYKKLDVGQNTYDDFITGNVKYYHYPYEDGTDIYLADIGVYFPSQYCNELNRKYPQMATLQSLLRHLGKAGFHANVQNPNRTYDKIREHYDKFILCRSCHVFGKLVFQKITVYEDYESFQKRVPVFPLRKPIINLNRRFMWEMQHTNYLISHGEIKNKILIYWNKSKYNTRVFKEILENGKKTEDDKKNSMPAL